MPNARRLWLGYAASLGARFGWALLYCVDRHLQTFLPLLVASTAALLVRAWRPGRWGRASVVLLVGLQRVSAADAPFYGGRERIAAALDLIRSGYDGVGRARLRRDADEVALGESLPAHAKVLLHTYRPSLGIDRDVVL